MIADCYPEVKSSTSVIFCFIKSTLLPEQSFLESLTTTFSLGTKQPKLNQILASYVFIEASADEKLTAINHQLFPLQSKSDIKKVIK